MKVMHTKGWGRLDNVVSEVELDNPTKESIQDAIAKMYEAYMGLHFDSILFAWEMYERCAIIGFGCGKFYGAIPDCPEELFPTPQQLVVIEKEKFDVLLAKVKEIADEMRRFGERHWMHDEGHRKKPIDKLTDWEWTTLVAALRYYENRMTIASATFPDDIILRFFQGAYSKRVCEQIARQFAETDHGIRGEEDWTKDKYLRDCDKLPWTKFYRFCQGYATGFHKVVLKDEDVQKEVDAFHVDWNDRWYPVKEYCECPYREIYCAPEFIVSIDGKPYEKGGEE